MKRILTIAGSDSAGGAGIQADLKAITLLGGYGMSVLTALTAQNTLGVQAIHEVPADFVGKQIDAVLSDIGADAIKTGMLANAEIIEVVAGKIRQYRMRKVVVDPVMVAKGGAPLLQEEAEEALILRLRRERRLGVKRLRNELHRLHGLALSPATVHKVLSRHGVSLLPTRRLTGGLLEISARVIHGGKPQGEGVAEKRPIQVQARSVAAIAVAAERKAGD